MFRNNVSVQAGWTIQIIISVWTIKLIRTRSGCVNSTYLCGVHVVCHYANGNTLSANYGFLTHVEDFEYFTVVVNTRTNTLYMLRWRIFYGHINNNNNNNNTIDKPSAIQTRMKTVIIIVRCFNKLRLG